MAISEDQLSMWTQPWFKTEEKMAEETRAKVDEALKQHNVLNKLPIKVFAKGSYQNNTNVRKDSDIDIAVALTSLIKVEYHEGVSDTTTGLTNYTGISEHDFKTYVCDALKEAFGIYAVDCTGNKTFKIRESKNIMNADIIPCTRYLECFVNEQREGIELILDHPDGIRHINFPEQHYKNGVNKNTETSRRYKHVVRILKNSRNVITEEHPNKNYHSFMIESLAYNIHRNIYLGKETWKEIVEDFCIDAWEYLKVDEPSYENERWVEVNDIKFLFHPHQKWTREDAKNFIVDIYNMVIN